MSPRTHQIKIPVLQLKCNKPVSLFLSRVFLTLYMMTKNFGKQIAVLALISVHVGASLFMPFSHQHVLCGTSSRQTIQSHDCGANERHKPLDDSCHCLLCMRDSSSIALLVFFSTVSKTSVQPLLECAASPTSSNGEHFSEPDRGPPSLSA